MYKLYSVHVNDLLICPKSLMQFSSSACPQLWSSDFMSPGGSAHLLCWSLQGGGFGSFSPYPRAQKCSGSPCACSSLSGLLFPFWACGPFPSHPMKVYSSIKIITACVLKNPSFLFLWDRKLHVRWNNQVSMTHVSYTAKPDPIMQFHKMEIKLKFLYHCVNKSGCV